MAPRWITLVLWTLVSVNSLTLVLGGLITWLSYTIPIRLKQFGLAPELAQVAGFASLLVACLGLCALNYSSHYALNAYGLSCAIFAVLMLFGTIPEDWSNEQRAAAAAAHQLRQAQVAKSLSMAVPQLAGASANGNQSSPAPPPAQNNSSGTTGSQNDHPKSSPGDSGTVTDASHGTGGILLDLIYFSLLTLLVTLLLSAFALAQYLRRKEVEEARRDGAEAAEAGAASEPEWQRALACRADDSPMCTCGPAATLAANQLFYYQQQQHQLFRASQQQPQQQQQQKSNFPAALDAKSTKYNNNTFATPLCPPAHAATIGRRSLALAAPIFTTQQQCGQNRLQSRLAGGNGSLKRRATQGSFLPRPEQQQLPHEQQQQRRRIDSCLQVADHRVPDVRQKERGSCEAQPLVHGGFYHTGGSMIHENLDAVHSADERRTAPASEDTNGDEDSLAGRSGVNATGTLEQLAAIDLRAEDENQDEEQERDAGATVPTHGCDEGTGGSKRDHISACDSLKSANDGAGGANQKQRKGLGNNIASTANGQCSKAASSKRAPKHAGGGGARTTRPRAELACRCHLLTDTSGLLVANHPGAQNSNNSFNCTTNENTLPNCHPMGNKLSWPPQYYCTMPRLNSSSAYAMGSNSKNNGSLAQYRRKKTGAGGSSSSSVMAMTAAAAAAFLGGVADSGLLSAGGVGGCGDDGADFGASDAIFDSNTNHLPLNDESTIVDGAGALLDYHPHYQDQCDGQYGFNTMDMCANLRPQSSLTQLYRLEQN